MTKVLTTLVLTYVELILIWFILWLIPGGDRFWWMSVLNAIPLYLFLPLPFCILLAAWLRNWALVIITLAPLLIFFGLFGAYYRPHFAQAQDQPDLRVMSYNVLFSNAAYNDVAQVILSQQPDLVALQEVQPAMMQELAHHLAASYPYHQMGGANPYGTTAIFSRYPFVENYQLDLQEDRPATVVTVAVKNHTVSFLSAHLIAYSLEWVPDYRMLPALIKQGTQARDRQAQILVNQVLTYDPQRVVILGCDCNNKETGSSYRLLMAGWPIGAPTEPGTVIDRRLMHIDYIFYRGPLTSNGVYVSQASGGSDHLPIVADLRFVGE
jgi:vancomycin resistance protein VanJ